MSLWLVGLVAYTAVVLPLFLLLLAALATAARSNEIDLHPDYPGDP
jgi:hypothetical protein